MEINDIDDLGPENLKQLVLFYNQKCQTLELNLLKEQMNYHMISKLYVDMQKKYNETISAPVIQRPAKSKTKTEK